MFGLINIIRLEKGDLYMKKDKLILKDKSEIKIESGASLNDIRVLFQDKKSMIETWDAMTKENLSEFQIQNSDGLTIGRYENIVLDSETSTTQEDGTILTSFHLREKTEVEILKEEINSLKEGQEVQDCAISDLGETVSVLAAEGGFA